MKIPKPQIKDSTAGKDLRISSFPCFKRLCEIAHIQDECSFDHEKEVFFVAKSRLMASANRMKEGSIPTKSQVIEKITESFVVKSSDSDDIKSEKTKNGGK
jgi:gamma-glutamyl-gamma-aminobutyrate hydrolase PuuD